MAWRGITYATLASSLDVFMQSPLLNYFPCSCDQGWADMYKWSKGSYYVRIVVLRIRLYS